MIRRHGQIEFMHHVVEHERTLYIGGVVATDTSVGMKSQTEQALAHLDELLTELGSDKSRILSATIYITDMSQKAAMNEAWIEWFDPNDLPTRATIGVAELGTPDTLVEIVTIAAR